MGQVSRPVDQVDVGVARHRACVALAPGCLSLLARRSSASDSGCPNVHDPHRAGGGRAQLPGKARSRRLALQDSFDADVAAPRVVAALDRVISLFDRRRAEIMSICGYSNRCSRSASSACWVKSGRTPEWRANTPGSPFSGSASSCCFSALEDTGDYFLELNLPRLRHGGAPSLLCLENDDRIDPRGAHRRDQASG